MSILTKDRVGSVLVVAAAVVGLVLVFDQHESDADDTPTAPPATSQFAPAPGVPAPPVVPGQDPAPAPAQPDDGDGDGDDGDDD